MKEHILIIEDEKAIQSVLYELLVDAGYEVSLAGDGLEGLMLFRAKSFSLILLDIMMPKIDGYAVCELMKGKTFVFNVNTEDFKLVSAPLSSFGSMVDTTVWVITVIGISVIVLLLVLWTRGRKKEIGILLAIGPSKAEIAGQLITENIIIALLSVCMSTALTMILADRIGTYIIGRAGENATDLTVSATASDMAATYGIGLAAVCLALIIASYTVLRLMPKDILTKMD